MKNIKIGNDFTFLWKIEKGRNPKGISNATNIKLFRYIGDVGRLGMKIPFELIEDDTLRIEVTPKIADRLGDYIFEVSYEFPNLSMQDGNEKYRIDANVFTIVPRTSQMSDDITEIPLTTVASFGFKGDKGDSAFVVWNLKNGGDKTYQDWIDFLQLPATEAKTDYLDVLKPQVNNEIETINTTVVNINDVVIPNAEQATQNAQGVSDDYINVLKPAIIEQGIITEAQGNTAESQGNEAKLIGEGLDNRIIELELHKNPMVVMSENEYDALENKDPDTYYLIMEE